MAAVLTGLAFAAWLTVRPPRSQGLRMFAIWMALLGLLEALPQVLIGTVIPQNDVGRAMDFLQMSAGAKLAACVAAVVVMATVCRWAAAQILALAPTADARPGFVFRAATLPALLAIVLIVPFRVPGAPIEVLFPPLVATVTTAVWLQAWSWRAAPAEAPPNRPTSVWAAAVDLATLLVIFQVVLRPGIPFF